MLSVVLSAVALCTAISTANICSGVTASAVDYSSVANQLNSSTGLPVMGLEVHAVATSQDSAGNNASLSWAVDGVSDSDTLHFAVFKSVDG